MRIPLPAMGSCAVGDRTVGYIEYNHGMVPPKLDRTRLRPRTEDRGVAQRPGVLAGQGMLHLVSLSRAVSRGAICGSALSRSDSRWREHVLVLDLDQLVACGRA